MSRAAIKNTKKPVAKPARRNLRKLAVRAAITLLLLTGLAIGLAAYKKQHAIEHDLSAIGNGNPTVVQVHDPSCTLCRQLRKGVESVRGQFEDRIQFRTANLDTLEGSALAQRHDVSNVTLLLFDSKGKVTRKIRGVRSGEELKPVFKRLADEG